MLNRTATALILVASLLLLMPSQRGWPDAIHGHFVVAVELELDPLS